MSSSFKIGHAVASHDGARWATRIDAGGHQLVSDEPPPAGADAGPGPFSIMVAALAACTSITLRMYAERKGWDVAGLGVTTTFWRGDDGAERVERVVTVSATTPSDQQTRLAEIADKTPVTLVMAPAVRIDTPFRQVLSPAPLPR